MKLPLGYAGDPTLSDAPERLWLVGHLGPQTLEVWSLASPCDDPFKLNLSVRCHFHFNQFLMSHLFFWWGRGSSGGVAGGGGLWFTWLSLCPHVSNLGDMTTATWLHINSYPNPYPNQIIYHVISYQETTVSWDDMTWLQALRARLRASRVPKAQLLHAKSLDGWLMLKRLCLKHVPSSKLTVCYWKWPFIVDLPMRICDFP